MARKNRKHTADFKLQAVKLSEEIGIAAAARELGIRRNALYDWRRVKRDGRLNKDPDMLPNSALELAEEVTALRERVKTQDEEIRCLKETNKFLAKASAFFAANSLKTA